MPTSLLSADSQFPDLERAKGSNEKFELLSDYLYLLLENLRYTLGNLGLNNFNENEFLRIGELITSPISIQLEGDEGELAQLKITAQGLSSRISDAEGNVSQLQQTAQGLALRVNNAEGDITSLQTTAEGLAGRISDAEGNITSLQATANGLSTRVSSAEGNISSLTQTANGLSTRVSDAEGNISSLTQKVDGFTLTASSANGSTVLSLTSQGTTLSTQTLNISVDAANIYGKLTVGQLPPGVATTDDIPTNLSDLVDDSDFVNRTGVVSIINGTVDADFVDALGISAKYLAGSYVYLLNSSGASRGLISITGASSAATAIDIESYGALRLTADYGTLHLESGSGTILDLSDYIQCGENIIPANDAVQYCGMISWRWAAVCAASETIITSDRNYKYDIEELPDKYLDMMDRIVPYRARYNDGTSGRYHSCFIAQEVKDAMDGCGISDGEFGGWVKDTDADGKEMQALRYGEFIPILWAKIRQLEEKVMQ